MSSFSAILVFVLVPSIVKCAFENNVCPTYFDYFTVRNNSNCWYNFAAESKVPDIIKRTGYPFMEYKVQTRDGYILTVFRIPSVNPTKPPVFMLHGVQSSSGVFVGLGRNSIAFLLADAGYDVWLGNYRGTEYSEGHTHLNITMREYWNYGADEIALIDLPAMLNLVKFHAGHKGKIIYIGHSLGTTAAMMYASEHPDHAKKCIQLFIWIAPAYKLTNMRSPYRLIFPLMKTALRFSNTLNVVQVVSRGYAGNFTRPTCLASPPMMWLCLGALNLFLGPLSQIPPETLPVYFNQLPGGTSLKTLTFLAESNRGKFKKFDYGGRNTFLYGKEEPPEYNISKINIPVVLVYAPNDWATTKEDAIELYSKLPKDVRYGRLEVKSRLFNHFDFLFGRNAKQLVYDPLMKMLKWFEKKKTRS